MFLFSNDLVTVITIIQNLVIPNMKQCAVIILITTFLIACSNEGTQMSIPEIEKLIVNRDVAQASIIIKQKLQNTPDNIQLRRLLAETHLLRGHYENAEKEFLKAEKLEEKPDFSQSFYDSYAETLFFTENYFLLEKLNQNISYLPTTAQEILVLTKVNKGFKLKEDSLALLLTEDRNRDAFERINTSSSVNQDNYFIAYQLVRALLKEQDYKSAQIISEKMTKVRKQDFRPKFYAMIASYKLNELEKANRYADNILENNKNSAIANLTKAAYFLDRKEFEQSKKYADLSINAGLNNADVRIIAGVAHYQLQNYERAYEHFSRIKSDIKRNSVIYTYIVATELELGIADTSDFQLQESDLSALQGLKIVDDLELEGNQIGADVLVNKISKLSLSDTSISKTVNLFLQSKGKRAFTEDDFKTILSTESTQERQLYISTFIAGGDIKSAFEALNHWLAKSPEDIDLLTLKGATLLKSNRTEEAKEVFLKIINIDNQNPRANTFIAADKLSNADYEGAIEGFKKVLSMTYTPNATAGLIRAANLTDSLDDNFNWLVSLNARQSNKNANLSTDIAFIYLKKGNVKEALKLLKDVETQSNLPNRFFMLKSSILASEENHKELEQTMTAWRESNGLNNQFVSFSLELYERQKEWAKGLSLIEEIKDLGQRDLPTVLSGWEAYFLARNNNLFEAERALNSISSDTSNYYADKARGFISASNSRWIEAAKSFESTYAQDQSTENAILLLKAYLATDNKVKIEKIAQKHMTQYPEDVGFKVRYAEWLFVKAPSDAIVFYEKMVEDELANINVYNNLSWLLQERGDLVDANKYIEQAIELDRNDINVIDTAISIKLKLGKDKEALELAANLYQNAEDSFKSGALFVKTLIATGDNQSAKVLLKKLSPKNSKESSVKKYYERKLSSRF